MRPMTAGSGRRLDSLRNDLKAVGCFAAVGVSRSNRIPVGRRAAENQRSLYLLDAWRESSLYSERERAALGWTEALTLVSVTHAPDDVYRALQEQFTEEERVMLTLLIVAINGWNRIQVAFRAIHPVGERQAA